MLLPISLICAPKKVRRDGTSLVFIQYCLNESNKTLLNTGIAIPPNFWNKKLKRVTDKLPDQFGKPDELNSELKRQVRLAEDIITYALKRDMTDPVRFVKVTFTPDFDLSGLDKIAYIQPQEKEKLKKDFFYQLEDYIKSRENRSHLPPSVL